MKKRNSIIVSILAFAFLIGGGGALLGIFCKKPDNSITFDDTDSYVKVDEIYNNDNSTFNKPNFDKLLKYIKGSSSIDPLKGETRTAEDIRNDNNGKDIVVSFGGLDWQVEYLSQDNLGNPILTLWLTNNTQEAWKSKTTQGRYYGFYEGGLFSDWSSNWYTTTTKDGDPEFYPSAMYGTSYIRAVTLNNGGDYALSGGKTLQNAQQDENSVFAKFTMATDDNKLPTYIVEPGKVEWQNYQNAKTQMSMLYLHPNEGYQANQDNTGYHSGYNYSTKAKYDTWKDDKLWLPSMTETGYRDSKIGIWHTSTEQRKNYNGSSSSFTASSKIGTDNTNGSPSTAYTYSWLRSGYYDYASEAYYLYVSGGDSNPYYVDSSLGVRPALHLNLNSAAESAGISTIETWLDFAASKFANEDKADGSEEHPYEISSAEELARLAYVVNNDLSNSAGVAYNTLNYKQTGDIQLGQYDWIPIGDGVTTRFSGTYDGSGYNIDGMYIDSDQVQKYHIGLFGIVDGGSGVKNVTIRSGKITSNSFGAWYYGSVAGVNYGSTINCKSYVDIQPGNGTAGGIIGYSDRGRIEYCVNYGNISAEYAGGIVGYGSWEETLFCTNYGNIYGKNRAGGICANDNDYVAGRITNCTVYGEISGEGVIGGLAPYTYDQEANITNCSIYATIIPTGTGQSIGAFVGDNSGGTTIENSFFIGTIRNVSPTAAFDGGSTYWGCYAIINGEKYYTDGDFSDWAISDRFNSGYPVQRELYWIMQFAPEFDMSYFDDWTKL